MPETNQQPGDDLRRGLEQRLCPWAIRPEALASIAQLAARYMAAAPDTPPAEAALPSSKVRGSVAVIPLRGVITPSPSFLSMLFGFGGGGLLSFRQMLREAMGSADIGSVIIDVDSPGGLIDLIPETAAEIRAARGTKPIVAVANTTAASAAYWLASQADEVVVTPSGEVGSIGVFMRHDDLSGMNEQLGIKTTLISAGKYKTELNPWEPLSDDAKAAAQQKVDELYAMFVTDVAAGRGVSAAKVRAGFGEGRMVLADDAVTEGMADRVETLEQTVTRLANGDQSTSAQASAGKGTPAANPPQGGEEPTARPAMATYLDVRYAPPA